MTQTSPPQTLNENLNWGMWLSALYATYVASFVRFLDLIGSSCDVESNKFVPYKGQFNSYRGFFYFGLKSNFKNDSAMNYIFYLAIFYQNIFASLILYWGGPLLWAAPNFNNSIPISVIRIIFSTFFLIKQAHYYKPFAFTCTFIKKISFNFFFI